MTDESGGNQPSPKPRSAARQWIDEWKSPAIIIMVGLFLWNQMDGVRTEVRTATTDLRAEITATTSGLRTEIGDFRSEINANNNLLRTNLETKMAASEAQLRADFNAGTTAISTQIQGVQTRFDTQITSLRNEFWSPNASHQLSITQLTKIIEDLTTQANEIKTSVASMKRSLPQN